MQLRAHLERYREAIALLERVVVPSPREGLQRLLGQVERLTQSRS